MAKVIYDQENIKEKILTEDMKGEQSFAGSMPELEDSSDTLQDSQEIGLYTEETEENPQEVGLAREVSEAEEAWRDSVA